MKILQVIIQDRTVLLFTESPDMDIVKLKEAYEDEDQYSAEYLGMPLGYESPELTSFAFLGQKHPCISLWFDSEDVPEFFTDFKPQI